MAEESTNRQLQVARTEDPSVLRVPDQLRPLPSWADLALVLAVCVPFWAGLTFLIATWL
jgi:hypothetical protein